MQKDVYQGDGLNLYAYCDNNPVMYFDPSGYMKQKDPDCELNGNISEGMDDAEPDTEGGLKTIDTGDLKVVQKRTPEIANNEWLARGYDKPPYAPDFEVGVVEAGNEKYVRVFSYQSDGTTNKLGGWIMRKSDIEGLMPAQIADKYALPQKPTHICDVIVDPDFYLQAGIANKVKEWGNGGGLQFDTMGKKLPQSAFANERIIGE